MIQDIVDKLMVDIPTNSSARRDSMSIFETVHVKSPIAVVSFIFATYLFEIFSSHRLY